MINRYIIICGEAEFVEDSVDRKLADGWDLHGGLVYTDSNGGDPNFAQAMTKKAAWKESD